jgi:EpsI family protein
MKKTDWHFLIACIILLAAMFFVRTLGRLKDVPLRTPLDTIPFQVHEFRGERLVASLSQADETSADSWILRQYRGGDAALPIHVLVAYWGSQNETKKIRPPSYAYRGYYWIRFKNIPMGGRETVVFREFLDVRGETKELVYYCYILDGRVIPSDYRLRYRSMIDSIIHGKTNAALIRISVVLGEGWSLADAELYTERFIRAFLPSARAFLPV